MLGAKVGNACEHFYQMGKLDLSFAIGGFGAVASKVIASKLFGLPFTEDIAGVWSPGVLGLLPTSSQSELDGLTYIASQEKSMAAMATEVVRTTRSGKLIHDYVAPLEKIDVPLIGETCMKDHSHK